jgi:hypothetical protein
MRITMAPNVVADTIQGPLPYRSQELDLNYDLDFLPYDQLIQYLLQPTARIATGSDACILLIQMERLPYFKDDCTAASHNYEDLVNAIRATTIRSVATTFLEVIRTPSPHLRYSQSVIDVEMKLRRCFLSVFLSAFNSMCRSHLWLSGCHRCIAAYYTRTNQFDDDGGQHSPLDLIATSGVGIFGL